MLDGLSAVLSCVHDDSITAAEILLTRNLGGFCHEVAEQARVFGGGFSERANVTARYEEQVSGCLRLNVGEAVAEIVAVDGLRGNLALKNAAEEAVHGNPSVAGTVHFWSGGK